MLVFIGLGGQEMLLILAALLCSGFLLPIIPLWIIFKKSGQNPAFSLLALVPGVGLLIALYVAAFAKWQTEQKASQ